ncbi:MAG: UDP-N-acetylglucosamine 2-epimerase [Scrofimicrobium sp.]
MTSALAPTVSKPEPSWWLSTTRIPNTTPTGSWFYGDTSSALAAAICTVKTSIPLVYFEAGLRSFNRKMLEDHNHVLTDHASNLPPRRSRLRPTTWGN